MMVANGWVDQLRTGVRLAVGNGGEFSELRTADDGSAYQRAAGPMGATFVGGSGRNLVLSGLPPALSGTQPPIGFFVPTAADVFAAGDFTLEVTGPSAATISDGVGVVAILSTGGTAPEGDYDSTTYGEETYNFTVDPGPVIVGHAFTLTADAEEGGGGVAPDVQALISAGTAQGGSYAAATPWHFVSVADADWTIDVASDGSAEMLHLTDVVASRAIGQPGDAAGAYEATTLGRAGYNLTDVEPVDGEAWRAWVGTTGRAPRVGTIYIEATEAAGVLDSVAGPFFATTMPASAGDTYRVPIAVSDGYSVGQMHEGLLLWGGG